MSLPWKGADYHRATPVVHEAWGRHLIAELGLRGDETVLDAGCGSGSVTALLLEAVPRGRVIGVDLSESMLAQARAVFAGHPRAGDVRLIQGDLTKVEWPEPAEVIFSSATFHWVKNHDALFRNLRRAVKPGGRMRAQCGGKGNIERIHGAVRRAIERAGLQDAMRDWKPVSNFATAEETADRLERAGFIDVKTWLEPWPTPPFPSEAEFLQFTKAVNLVQVLAKLPDPADQERLLAAFAQEIAGDGKGWFVDYVRLNIACAAPR